MNKTTLHWSYLNFKDVPMDLYLYEDIEEVYLKENFITTIPKWLLNVTTLKFIHLAGNNLSTIPEQIYLLENLEFLDVSNNQIRQLPKTIGLMERLQRLNVSGNELSELPAACMVMLPGHGVLVTNETPLQLEKELETFGISGGEETRQSYRNTLFSVKEGLPEYISAVIVDPEVLNQITASGCALHCQMRRKGILVGVTVDKGLVALSCSLGEYTSQGLDGLAKRCTEYKECGCDITMWRVQFNIAEFTPSYQALIENANTLGRYAAVSQASRMLPILEVDIVAAEDTEFDRLERVVETALMYVYKALCEHHVNLEGTLLKVAVLSSLPKSSKRLLPDETAKATMELLKRVVPSAVAGIILQVEERSQDKILVQLNAAMVDPTPKPWPLSYSFDGSMQSAVMIAWAGQDGNVENAQCELMEILKSFSQAACGSYVSNGTKSSTNQCFCKSALNSFKTVPPPFPDDCIKYDEISRPPTGQLLAENEEMANALRIEESSTTPGTLATAPSTTNKNGNGNDAAPTKPAKPKRSSK